MNICFMIADQLLSILFVHFNEPTLSLGDSLLSSVSISFLFVNDELDQQRNPFNRYVHEGKEK